MTSTGLDVAVRVARGGYLLDVQLQVARGDVVAVMGPSGAGKSTLFAAIAGFAPLTEGHVGLNGRTLDAAAGHAVPPHRRGVVLLGQEPRLFPHLSARENVAFGPRARRVHRRQARMDADAWLERVGLAGAGDRRPAQLSGGQQQRVALARALATSPLLLLLDEPLTSLDPETAAGIRAVLNDQLAQTGTTTLVATHDAGDAASLADRLVVIEDGRITQQGRPREVWDAPATAFVRVLAGARPEPVRSGWEARIVDARTDGDGVIARVLTADGDELVLRLPAEADPIVGAVIAVRSPGV
ncbi:ABC transporter ATP-binding protein [Microbacterium terrisoli]|uniref:ABC transporter ATP-binding protein n=1 Tax=Microbacterium terrisoli TaxID=3242192 RepID=UPI002805D994|nr:ATP-binding cassette domain-containing protein [Microbacterium protaetiae]